MSSEDSANKLSFSVLLTTRMFLYPSCIVLGESILTLFGQSMVLSAVPSLFSLVALAAISACLLTPIFYCLRYLIEQYLSSNTTINNLSKTLLYTFDIFLNVSCIASLATLIHSPVMNIYVLYGVLGAGVVPSVSLCLILALIIQACSAHYHSTDASPNDDQVFTVNEEEDSSLEGDLETTMVLS